MERTALINNLTASIATGNYRQLQAALKAYREAGYQVNSKLNSKKDALLTEAKRICGLESDTKIEVQPKPEKTSKTSGSVPAKDKKTVRGTSKKPKSAPVVDLPPSDFKGLDGSKLAVKYRKKFIEYWEQNGQPAALKKFYALEKKYHPFYNKGDHDASVIYKALIQGWEESKAYFSQMQYQAA